MFTIVLISFEIMELFLIYGLLLQFGLVYCNKPPANKPQEDVSYSESSHPKIPMPMEPYDRQAEMPPMSHYDRQGKIPNYPPPLYRGDGDFFSQQRRSGEVADYPRRLGDYKYIAFLLIYHYLALMQMKIAFIPKPIVFLVNNLFTIFKL